MTCFGSPVAASNALPGANVVLTLGLTKASINLGGSCNLLNAPLIVVVGMKSSLAGTASLPVSISPQVKILGAIVYMQYGVADPSAAGGIAVTRGAAVRI